MHTKLGSHDHNWMYMHKIFEKYGMTSLRACEYGISHGHCEWFVWYESMTGKR